MQPGMGILLLTLFMEIKVKYQLRPKIAGVEPGAGMAAVNMKSG